MVRFLFLALFLCVIFTSVHGQKKLQEVDLKINGIGSGSSYNAVLAKFGKPTKQKIERTEKELSCVDADETYRRLEYPGLEVELLELRGSRESKVVAFNITSTKWSASGVRIGRTPGQVAKLFGKANSTNREAGKMIYSYVTPGNLGWVHFEFLVGRLVKIVMSETLC